MPRLESRIRAPRLGWLNRKRGALFRGKGLIGCDVRGRCSAIKNGAVKTFCAECTQTCRDNPRQPTGLWIPLLNNADRAQVRSRVSLGRAGAGGGGGSTSVSGVPNVRWSEVIVKESLLVTHAGLSNRVLKLVYSVGVFDGRSIYSNTYISTFHIVRNGRCPSVGARLHCVNSLCPVAASMAAPSEFLALFVTALRSTPHWQLPHH